jgi:hypothetical protein
MSIALADALEDVELVEGQTHHCQVHGRQVEVRVLAKPQASAGLSEDDVMLDPWCELPGPPVVGALSSQFVARLPFDVPEIPGSEDTE